MSVTLVRYWSSFVKSARAGRRLAMHFQHSTARRDENARF